ncbi:hypothetical protein Tco_0802927 [Tanacetum coccineum]|uniref:Reverse transcriptase domain-containing protein n=1 Tax=Tanacetum coccineum TaxID=301880 RepID=A0ABQ5A063_9ASTR
MKILQDNIFNDMNGVDVTNHIARVLEITEWIKIPNVEKNVLRLHVFSKSLSGDAEKWWNDEIEGKAIGWNETCNKFCHKYYSLSHSSNCKEIDKNTQNGLWEFYVNEPTKGAMGNLNDEPRNEIIMESLVKKKQKGAILELKQRHLKNTIFCTYTPYPAMKIRRISASSAQETRNDQFSIWPIFTNEWDLASLEYSQETEGPYSTDLPTLDDIRRLLELERVMVDRTIKSQTVTLTPNQILTKELSPDMKQWEELIRENVFELGGHRDHLPACLAHMLYCVVAEEQYNLAYFFVKRIECARANPTALSFLRVKQYFQCFFPSFT